MTIENETTSVLFTIDELWLLQRCIRHEIVQREQWNYPPASVDLNDQIAAALLFCTVCKATEAALRLSRGDLFAIDFTVPADAKDVNGKSIGRAILLKSFSARDALRGTYPGPDVSEPTTPTKIDIYRRLQPNLESDDWTA